MIRQLAAEQKDVLVFCSIYNHTLIDQNFFPQLLDYLQHSPDLSNSLLFELGQDVFERCGPQEKANLHRLAEMGYRFSMNDVNTLDLNFAELRDRRFSFVKILPELILSSLPDEDDDFETIRIQAIGTSIDINSPDIMDDIAVVESHFDEDEAEDVEREELELDSELAMGSQLALAQPDLTATGFKDVLSRYGLDLIVERIETEDDMLDIMRFNVDYGQGSLFGDPNPVGLSENVDSSLSSHEPDRQHMASGPQSLHKTGTA